MDSQDLSPSSSSTPSGDASSMDEDDVSSTAGIAKEAACLFNSQRYAECIDVLNKLLQKKPNNPKVLHNLAVAKYFLNGCSDPRALLEVLKKFKTRSRELACASEEKAEIVSNPGNSVISGSKGSSITRHQCAAANSASVSYVGEFDTSIAMFNTAVILFHIYEYVNARLVLEPLYQNISPIDETTALHIRLLLLDVSLFSHDASRAADVILYLANAFGVSCLTSPADNGGVTSQHQSLNLVKKAFLSTNNSTSLEASNSDPTASLNASENPLSRTQSDDAAKYETLLSTLNIDVHNLEKAADPPSLNDFSRSLFYHPASAGDLKLKLHLYIVQFLLLTRNLKAVKREVKELMNIVRGDSCVALLLKSQFEYTRGNYHKAIKILMASNSRMESGIENIFNNNLGCIYHCLGKHHTSLVFFSKALRISSSLRSEKPLKLLNFSQDKSLLIVYNCGLQYLACGRPTVAARCFQKASLILHSRPLLWLRMAECCLLALEKGHLRSSGLPANEEVRVHVVGKGKWRQLVLEDGDLRSKHLDPVEHDGRVLGSDSQLYLSIPFARQCLYNAFHLLYAVESKFSKSTLPPSSVSEEDKLGHSTSLKGLNHKNLPGGDSKPSNETVVSAQAIANGDAKELKGGTGLIVILQNSISSYEDLLRRENRMIKQAVLANLAYVELNLENPLKALLAARYLLRLPECSQIYIFLGHVYVAEALCHLNRPKEAAEHLSVYVSDGNKIELPYSEEDTEKWRVEKGTDSEELNSDLVTVQNPSLEEHQAIVFIKPDEACGALYVNLAIVSVMQQHLEQAYQYAIKALSIIPRSLQAILTAVYVELLLGKTREALARLKQCRHVIFLPSNAKLNSSW
ncbi:hypothetical protein L1049_004925 [Liquidambar formosana]|uniref:CCR4-NOT transcription complex subunit 10 n=1 Tax=Liquidambar formosana TaxID=63359 RepID=A0AAP0RNY5_LIQFO